MSTIDFFVEKKVEIKKSNFDFMSKALFLDISISLLLKCRVELNVLIKYKVVVMPSCSLLLPPN
jgi:hypothetical protein